MDLGATWLRAVAVDGTGRVIAPSTAREELHRARGTGRKVARERRPRPAPGQLPSTLRRLLRRWKLRADVLTVGAAGVGDARARDAMRRTLSALAPRVIVLTDLETAWLAALGGRAGILILAGTGSCAYGRDACGHVARAGGEGPLLGDDGSAFWIGKQWVKTLPAHRILKLAHHPEVIRVTAALARTVLKRRASDKTARGILREAHRALVSKVESVAGRLHFRGPIPLSWHGGLFRSPAFRKDFLRLLRRSRRSWSPIQPQARAEDAAALLGLSMCHASKRM